MNIGLKIFLIVLNLIVLVLAMIWINSNSPKIEPYIVIVSQVIALLVLFFERKLPFTSIGQVSESEIDLNIASKDQSDIKIKDIKDNSKVKIKRENDI